MWETSNSLELLKFSNRYTHIFGIFQDNNFYGSVEVNNFPWIKGYC